MAGASDFMVGNAPGGVSYAPPLLNFSNIGNLAEDYYKNQLLANQLAQQNAYSQGVPMVNGQPDQNAIIQRNIQLGGTQAAGALLPFLQKKQFLDQENQPEPPSGALNTTAAPSSPTTTSGPSNITGQFPSQQPQSVAARPVTNAGQGDAGENTIMSMVTDAVGPEKAGEISNRIATAWNNAGGGKGQQYDVNDPLSPQDVMTLKARLASLRTSTPAPTAPAPAAQAAPPAEQPGEPAPATFNQRFAQAGTGTTPAGAMVPDAWKGREQGYADSLDKRATALERTAFKGDVVGVKADALLKTAQGLRDQAKQIREALGKSQEQTPAMKEAAAEGRTVSGQKLVEEQQKTDVARYAKQMSGIEEAAATSAKMRDHMAFSKSLINSPDFYSGAGEHVVLGYKRMLAALGGNPNAAVPQEAFRKIMAANVLDQVNQLKAEAAAGGGGGRIFQSQIALMEKAAQNPDNTIASNRLLTELVDRGAARSKAIADMAAGYKNGHLDAGFNRMLRDWEASNPLFSARELADPRLIAPPTFRNPAEARKANLPSGTPIRTLDGRIVYTP